MQLCLPTSAYRAAEMTLTEYFYDMVSSKYQRRFKLLIKNTILCILKDITSLQLTTGTFRLMIPICKKNSLICHKWKFDMSFYTVVTFSDPTHVVYSVNYAFDGERW